MPVEFRFAHGGKGVFCARLSGWFVFDRTYPRIMSHHRIQRLREISGLEGTVVVKQFETVAFGN